MKSRAATRVISPSAFLFIAKQNRRETLYIQSLRVKNVYEPTLCFSLFAYFFSSYWKRGELPRPFKRLAVIVRQRNGELSKLTKREIGNFFHSTRLRGRWKNPCDTCDQNYFCNRLRIKSKQILEESKNLCDRVCRGAGPRYRDRYLRFFNRSVNGGLIFPIERSRPRRFLANISRSELERERFLSDRSKFRSSVEGASTLECCPKVLSSISAASLNHRCFLRFDTGSPPAASHPPSCLKYFPWIPNATREFDLPRGCRRVHRMSSRFNAALINRCSRENERVFSTKRNTNVGSRARGTLFFSPATVSSFLLLRFLLGKFSQPPIPAIFTTFTANVKGAKILKGTSGFFYVK